MYKCTAKDWRDANSKYAKKGMNIRDFSSINELVVLSNLENLNAVMITENIEKPERFIQLNKIAKSQLSTLDGKNFMKSLKKLNDSTFIDEQNKLDKK